MICDGVKFAAIGHLETVATNNYSISGGFLDIWIYFSNILHACSSTSQLAAYCDSDWVGCATTRRSTSGLCVLLWKYAISWKSKRQFVVARSTAETEYISMTMILCEVMWLKQLLKYLGLKHQARTPIFCVNHAALAISANPVHHEKIKHVDIYCNFIRDKATEGVIHLTYVPSSQQLANIFTK